MSYSIHKRERERENRWFQYLLLEFFCLQSFFFLFSISFEHRLQFFFFFFFQPFPPFPPLNPHGRRHVLVHPHLPAVRRRQDQRAPRGPPRRHGGHRPAPRRKRRAGLVPRPRPPAAEPSQRVRGPPAGEAPRGGRGDAVGRRDRGERRGGSSRRRSKGGSRGIVGLRRWRVRREFSCCCRRRRRRHRRRLSASSDPLERSRRRGRPEEGDRDHLLAHSERLVCLALFPSRWRRRRRRWKR